MSALADLRAAALQLERAPDGGVRNLAACALRVVAYLNTPDLRADFLREIDVENGTLVPKTEAQPKPKRKE